MHNSTSAYQEAGYRPNRWVTYQYRKPTDQRPLLDIDAVLEAVLCLFFGRSTWRGVPPSGSLSSTCLGLTTILGLGGPGLVPEDDATGCVAGEGAATPRAAPSKGWLEDAALARERVIRCSMGRDGAAVACRSSEVRLTRRIDGAGG
jgi:hypothetical protein